MVRPAPCPFPLRFAAQAGPIERRMGAAHRLAKRQRTRLPVEAFSFPAGSARTQRYELPRRRFPAEGGPAERTGTPSPGVLDRVDPISNSYGLQCRLELLPEFTESGTDSCLHGPKRLIQLCRHFRVSQFGKKRALDHLPLFRREDLQGVLQDLVLLLNVPGLLRVICCGRDKWILRIRVDSFFSTFEPQSVNCPGACLVHDPTDDGPARRIVSRRSSPHVVEHIDRQFFSGFAIVGYPHDQCKSDSVRLFVKRMQRKLIPCSDGLDEPDPVLLGYGKVSLIRIEQIAEGFCLRFRLLPVSTCCRIHDKNHAPSRNSRQEARP